MLLYYLEKWSWAEFEFSAWGASWSAWRARLARASGSLRARALSGVQGQGPWAGGLGDAVPQKLITFSQLKDPKSLLQVTVKVVIVN